MNKLEITETRDALFDTVANRIATCLIEGISARGQATFAGSGGGTPAPVFDRLSLRTDVDWSKVDVTLSDERRSPPEDEKDNARQTRAGLLKEAGGAARFVPLESPNAIDHLPAEIDSVLLGMGGDGHFASIFPEGDGMAAALTETESRIVGTTPHPLPSGAPYPRWTFTLSTIAKARQVILLFTGSGKREIFERALGEGPTEELPVRALLRHPNMALSCIWAP